MANVSLTPRWEQWIQEQCDAGGFMSASEVVRAALRCFEDAGAMSFEHAVEKRLVALGIQSSSVDLKGRIEQIADSHSDQLDRIEAIVRNILREKGSA